MIRRMRDGAAWRETAAVVTITAMGIGVSVALADEPIIWGLIWLGFGLLAGVALAVARSLVNRPTTRWKRVRLRSPELRDALARARACASATNRLVYRRRARLPRSRVSKFLDDVEGVVGVLEAFCRRVDRYREPAASAGPRQSGGRLASGDEFAYRERHDYLTHRLPRLIDGTVADLELAHRVAQQFGRDPMADFDELATAVADRLADLWLEQERLEKFDARLEAAHG